MLSETVSIVPPEGTNYNRLFVGMQVGNNLADLVIRLGQSVLYLDALFDELEALVFRIQEDEIRRAYQKILVVESDIYIRDFIFGIVVESH